MVAFFNGSGQQVLPAEIPPSCVVAIPLYLLYEMSILMIKDKKKTEEEVEDEAGDEVALSEE